MQGEDSPRRSGVFQRSLFPDIRSTGGFWSGRARPEQFFPLNSGHVFFTGTCEKTGWTTTMPETSKKHTRDSSLFTSPPLWYVFVVLYTESFYAEYTPIVSHSNNTQHIKKNLSITIIFFNNLFVHYYFWETICVCAVFPLYFLERGTEGVSYYLISAADKHEYTSYGGFPP